jgi:hypothetical protein
MVKYGSVWASEKTLLYWPPLSSMASRLPVPNTLLST